MFSFMEVAWIISLIIISCSVDSVFAAIERKCANRIKEGPILLADNFPTDFSSQYINLLYSIPVGMFMNASVIIGEIYVHRNEPFSPTLGHHHNQKASMSTLPFASFFDWEYFHQYWSKYGLKLLEEHYYHGCELQNITTYHYPNKQNQQSLNGYLTRNTLLQSIIASSIPIPIPKDSIITLTNSHKLHGMYNFWAEPHLLQYMHQSIQPSPEMFEIFQHLIAFLPAHYYGAHLRVDSDLWWGKNVSTFKLTKEKAIGHLLTSSCYHDFLRANNKLLDLPALYVSSSFLNQYSTTSAVSNGRNSIVLHDRAKSIIQELLQAGFPMVLTLNDLLEKYFYSLNDDNNANNNANNMNTKSTNTKGHHHTNKRYAKFQYSHREIIKSTQGMDIFHFKRLTNEQLLYLDNLILRQANCFTSGHLSNEFSYLIQRQRQWDQNKFGSYESITENSFGPSYQYRDIFGL